MWHCSLFLCLAQQCCWLLLGMLPPAPPRTASLLAASLGLCLRKRTRQLDFADKSHPPPPRPRGSVGPE